MILHDLVLERQQYNDIVAGVNDMIGDSTKPIIMPTTTIEGTMFCLPETIWKTLKAKGYSIAKDIQKDDIQKLFNIRSVSFPIPVVVTSMLIQLAERSDVYGVIGYTDVNIPVNLFHPLTPAEHLTYKYKKIVVYTYVEDQTIDPDLVNKELSLLSYIVAALSSAYEYKQLKAPTAKISLQKRPLSFALPSLTAVITSEARAVLPASETSEHGLIPHYFMTRGIYYPFYGVSLYKMVGTGRKGADLTPMISANISGIGDICIGNLPKTEYDSYRCLNCSNLDSPYRREILPNTYASIAEAHKQMALSIIKGLDNDNNRQES